MITVSDLVHLPFTPDLIEGGITYALRSLPYTYDRMGGSPYDRLRRVAAGVAVELAFRRYLTEQDLPFDIKGATPFTDPDHYDVSLGGRRCDIKSFLITWREQISDMRRNPGLVLHAPALVPTDQYAADGHTDEDIYLFTFLSGLIAASQDDLKKAIDADQQHYLIHVLPDSWCKPSNWMPLGSLALKSESASTLTVELGGQNEARDHLTRIIELPPLTRMQIDDPFFSLSYVHAKSIPDARLGIYSPTRKETYLIPHLDWGNIHVYGMDIVLAGHITRGEFRRRASLIQPGSRVFQYNQTRTKNLAVPVTDLKPIHHLLERVKEWKKATA